MATANQAVTLLNQMDASRGSGEEAATLKDLTPEPSPDAIYSHIADYMEVVLA